MYPKKPDVEIEVKFCILDPQALEKKLVSLGAILTQPRSHEYNIRFDTNQGDLARRGQVLRLRRDTRVRMTYKGPDAMRGRINNRPEIEFSASDFESAKKFIQALGYQVSVIYEKFRTTYVLDNLIVTIDEMPYGIFSEIEGSHPAEIEAAAGALGLDWEARAAESYLMIFERAKAALGLTFRDLTFENFQSLEMGLDTLGLIPADRPNS